MWRSFLWVGAVRLFPDYCVRGGVSNPFQNWSKSLASNPTFLPLTISRHSDYPAQELPDVGIETLGTPPPFLAARYDAPSAMVQAALEALYEPPLELPGLIPADRAAERQVLAFHPTARRYFALLGRPSE